MSKLAQIIDVMFIIAGKIPIGIGEIKKGTPITIIKKDKTIGRGTIDKTADIGGQIAIITSLESITSEEINDGECIFHIGDEEIITITGVISIEQKLDQSDPTIKVEEGIGAVIRTITVPHIGRQIERPIAESAIPVAI